MIASQTVKHTSHHNFFFTPTMQKTVVVNPVPKQSSILITNAAGNTGRAFLYHVVNDPVCRFSKIICCLMPGQEGEYKALEAEFENCPQVEIYIVDPLSEETRYSRYERSSDEMQCGLREAMDGVDYVYLIPTVDSERAAHCQKYLEAAEQANVKFLVFVSVLGQELTQFGWMQDYNRMEKMLEQSSIPHAVLRCALFMETFFAFSKAIRNKHLPLPIGDGRTAPVSVEDVSFVAYQIFTEPHKHAKGIYEIVGPQVMNGMQMAQAISKALGYKIRFQSPSTEETKRALMATLADEWLADGVCDMFSMLRHGHLVISETQQTIFFESASAKPMITLEEFFGRNKEYFQPERTAVVWDEQVQQFHEEIKACVDAIPVQYHHQVHQLIESILYPLEQGIGDLKKILRILRSERRSLIITQAEIEDEEVELQNTTYSTNLKQIPIITRQ